MRKLSVYRLADLPKANQAEGYGAGSVWDMDGNWQDQEVNPCLSNPESM